jgi:hypothetical protein
MKMYQMPMLSCHPSTRDIRQQHIQTTMNRRSETTIDHSKKTRDKKASLLINVVQNHTHNMAQKLGLQDLVYDLRLGSTTYHGDEKERTKNPFLRKFWYIFHGTTKYLQIPSMTIGFSLSLSFHPLHERWGMSVTR